MYLLVPDRFIRTPRNNIIYRTVRHENDRAISCRKLDTVDHLKSSEGRECVAGSEKHSGFDDTEEDGSDLKAMVGSDCA